MSLENEIKQEIKRLEEEKGLLDKEVSKLELRLKELNERRERLLHDLSILKAAFEPHKKQDKQRSLFSLRT